MSESKEIVGVGLAGPHPGPGPTYSPNLAMQNPANWPGVVPEIFPAAPVGTQWIYAGTKKASPLSSSTTSVVKDHFGVAYHRTGPTDIHDPQTGQAIPNQFVYFLGRGQTALYESIANLNIPVLATHGTQRLAGPPEEGLGRLPSRITPGAGPTTAAGGTQLYRCIQDWLRAGYSYDVAVSCCTPGSACLANYGRGRLSGPLGATPGATGPGATGMSTTTKVLIGVAAVAAVVVGYKMLSKKGRRR